MAPLGATKLTKVNDQQLIYCLFIYSLHLFPALPFSLRAHKLRKRVELSWFPVLLKFVVWLTSFPRWRCFHRAILLSSLAFLWSYLNLLSNSTFRSTLVKSFCLRDRGRLGNEGQPILLKFGTKSCYVDLCAMPKF